MYMSEYYVKNISSCNEQISNQAGVSQFRTVIPFPPKSD